jgi:N-acetylglutamate synthase
MPFRQPCCGHACGPYTARMPPTLQLCSHDISAIEIATCEAVSPARVERVGPWLVSLDHGSVGRAKTAVALTHDAAQADALLGCMDEVQNIYAQAGLPPAFRLADVPALSGVSERLRALGFTSEQPTCVMVASTQALLAQLTQVQSHKVHLSAQPNPDWASVYTHAGFNAQDGAHRVRVLSRARQALYASISLQGQSVAAGMLALSGDWASVHGMRTVPALQRQGLCSALLAAMAHTAQASGLAQFFLQVEEGNSAISLYQRFGFAQVWRYHYWYQGNAKA